MSSSPGFRGGAICSAVPNNVTASPYSTLPCQRTERVARVSCRTPSNSTDSSWQRKEARPLGATFGSVTTIPRTLIARGASPRSCANFKPAESSSRKLCNRNKAEKTTA